MKELLRRIRQILKDRRVRKFFTRFVATIASIVVFVTTYALILPAITMETEASCGLIAHQHDDSCYTSELVCETPESDGHKHTDDCYSIEEVLTCEETEHEHGEDCYDEDGNLICTIPEHQHDADNGCYTEQKTLTCEIEESKGHHHGPECYEKVLTCGLEAHTHSAACYRDDADDTAAENAAVASTESAAIGASTGAAIIDEHSVDNDESGSTSYTGASTEVVNGDPGTTGASATGSTTVEYDFTEESATAATTNVMPEEVATEDLSEGYVPQLDAVDMDVVLDKHTGFYYFDTSAFSSDHPDEELPASSSDITDWQEYKEGTELENSDLLRLYLSYTVPAGTLNETNQVSRYRLPSNIRLTDEQIIAINETVNGVAAGYKNYDTLEITDVDKYEFYKGAEAIEGTRTPDQAVNDYLYDQVKNGGEGQEYISAVVKAENIVNERSGEIEGQDLIFIWTPYSIEKNQHEYDKDGQPVKAGEKITGWFSCDFNCGQVEWVEGDTTTDELTNEDGDIVGTETKAEKTADVVFVEKDKEIGTKEISQTLTLVEKTVEEQPVEDDPTVDDTEDSSEGATEDAAVDGAEESAAVDDHTDDATTGEAAEVAADDADASSTAATETLADGTPTEDVTDTTPAESTEDSAEAEEPVYKSGILTASGDGYAITLKYREDAQIPEDAKLHVVEITKASDSEAYEACVKQAGEQIAGEAYDADTIVDEKTSRFFDIEIQAPDAFGEYQKIEPAAYVLVSIKLDEMPVGTDSDGGSGNDQQKPSVLHFAEDGIQEMVLQTVIPSSNDSTVEDQGESDVADGADTADSSNSDDATEAAAATQENMEGSIQFVTDGFSTYGVVYSTLRTTMLTASGETYEITINYDAGAGIPEGSELQVREIEPGTDEYYDYLGESARQMSLLTEDVAFARFFDIEILKEGEKIEPLTPVNVQIDNKGVIQGDDMTGLKVVHFGDNGMEQIPQVGVSEDGTRLAYSQNSFSVTGVVVPYANAESGRTYVLVVNYNGNYYSIDNDGYLTPTTYDDSANTATITTTMPMLWTYHKDDSNSYLRHAATAKHIDPSTQCADQWYYRYIDPKSETGLSEESGNQDFTTGTDAATINYTGTTITSSSNSNYRIGVKTVNGKLMICGQEEGEAVNVILADVAANVPGVNPNKDTVSHIDISIEGNAEIDVPLAYGTYYYGPGEEAFTVSADNQKTITLKEDVPINTDDMKNARITAYKRNANGEKVEIENAFYITGYSANSATEYSTQQVRIEGSFKVADVPESVYTSVGGSSRYPRGDESANAVPYGSNESLNNSATYRQARLDNRIYYNVAATKTITFTLVDENGRQLYREKNGEYQPITITADVTLTASFDYWDSRNECPPLQYYWQWQQGGIYDWMMDYWTYQNTYSSVSGMDFVLGGDSENSHAHISAVEITKILVDEQGNRIEPDESGTMSNVFYIFSNTTYDPSVEGLDVGRYTTAYANYGSYTQVDTRAVSIGDSGLGAIYDYDVPEGMVYIQEDPNSITQSFSGSVDDGESREWSYRSTYIQTEYVWRQNGDSGQMHYSDTFKKGDTSADAYKSIPDVLGSYYGADGSTEWNGFLEFYVYNVYDNGSTDIEETKEWWEGFDDLPEQFTITVNNNTYTFNKSDLRVDMKLTQYVDGTALATLQDVPAGMTDTITLKGVADADDNQKQGEFEAWVASWKELPTKSIDGSHTYTYKVTEEKVYTATDPNTNLLGSVFTNTTSEDGLTITNKPIASKTSLHVKKYWDGVDEDAGIVIPTGATIDIILGRYKLVGSATTVDTNLTLSAPSTNDANAVVRYVEKPNAAGKTPDAPDNLSTSWKYIYDSSYVQTTDITTTYAALLNNGNSWEADIPNLDETDAAGHPYAYFIQAVIEHGIEEGTRPVITLESNGRIRTFSSGNDKDLIVTNYLPTYTSIDVTKRWLDENGKTYVGDWPEEMQGETLTFTLYHGPDSSHQTTTGRTGEIRYDTATGTGTVLTFDKLPEKDSNGNPIVYTVVESSVSGFTPTVTYDSEGNATVTNTKVKAGLRVEKVWRGVPDATGFPAVYFTLYRTTDHQNGNNPEVVNGYNNEVLSEENNWTWVCPIELPVDDGQGNKYLYYVQENSQGSGIWTFHYYSNSSNTYTTAWNQGFKSGIEDDGTGVIEGTLTIHNKLNSYKNLDIRKQNFYIYNDNNQRVDGINGMKQNTIIGVKIIRRIKFGENDYSDWEDYGDEMLVGYQNGQQVSDNGDNDFYLKNAGDWYFQIFDQGGNYLDQDMIGLPINGYYIRNGSSIQVTYEYDIRETGVYKDLNKTPYDDWEWHSVMDGNVLKNYLASDLRIEKKWVGKAGGTEVYVKIYRKLAGGSTYENFTDVIVADVLNGNREGYVTDTSIVDTDSDKKWLIVKNSGISGGSITINNVPIHEIRNDEGSAALYEYYAVEVGYKDRNGTVHWTDYNNASDGFSMAALGDLAKFDPSYKMWDASTGTWESIASNDPRDKIQTIGEIGTNRIQITNTSRMEMYVEKEWEGFEANEIPDSITFRIEQTRTPYENGAVSGNSSKSDLYFTTSNNANDAVNYLTVTRTGDKTAKVEATGRVNYYKLTYNDIASSSDYTPWKLKIDGLQEVYVGASGIEYHCSYKILEVSATGCTTTYSVLDSNGNEIEGQTLATEDGHTLKITNTKANAEVVIKKIKQKANPTDADEFISGAKFELWKKASAQASEYSVQVTKDDIPALDNNNQFTITSEDGFKLENLAAGEYQLVEVEAPQGYVILDNKPVTFKIEGNKVTQINGEDVNRNNGKITVDNGVEFTPSDSVSDTSDTFTVPNTLGVELPSTGGSGTRLIYLLGGMLTLAAGLLLLHGRKRIGT